MVFGNRLINIHLFWRPTIRIVKIAIRFSTREIQARQEAAFSVKYMYDQKL